MPFHLLSSSWIGYNLVESAGFFFFCLLVVLLVPFVCSLYSLVHFSGTSFFFIYFYLPIKSEREGGRSKVFVGCISVFPDSTPYVYIFLYKPLLNLDPAYSWLSLEFGCIYSNNHIDSQSIPPRVL